jgi:hypothetical protein
MVVTAQKPCQKLKRIIQLKIEGVKDDWNGIASSNRLRGTDKDEKEGVRKDEGDTESRMEALMNLS